MKSPFSKWFLIFILGAFIACNDQAADEDYSSISDTLNTAEESVTGQENVMDDDSIHVKLQLEKIDTVFFNLSIHMNLFGDTWLVSPLEKTYPFGEMSIEFDQNDHFVLTDSIIENPNSEYKDDPNWEAPYRVISGETTLNQKIKRVSKADFEVVGHIFFVLEPICTPNKLNFKIVHKDGELTVQQID